MELILKNIGMIKEAQIKLNGLTIIAGENDTGKSSVGKTIFLLLKARTFAKANKIVDFKNKIEWLKENIFKNDVIKENSFIKLDDIVADFKNNNFLVGKRKFLEAIFCETPFIFNMYETLNAINRANSILDFKIPYNYLWWDLFVKLSFKAKTFSEIDLLSLKQTIKNIINGEFIHYSDMNREKWIYKKENIEFEMDNTAMGIKQFGIIYSLIENGYLTKDRILIIDEPEVHLHPKWQIEYAKILVELAKNGIKILLTSHSPFFIEAIENLYPANFYLAKDGFIKKCNPNDIYELLSESIDILEDLQMESREW